MEPGGTRRLHGTHKWYAIKKSLGTIVIWFLLSRLLRILWYWLCFSHALLGLAYVVYHSIVQRCGCRVYFKICKH